MPELSIVGIGEFKAGQGCDRLSTYGIGSCVGIALYDPSTRQGGLAHTLLPRFSGPPAARTAKFTDVAIELMLEHLIKSGCDARFVVAKLAGGATMFDNLYREGQVGVGERNVEAARETLARLAVPVIAEDVGGNMGRSIAFDLADGFMTIRTLTTATRI